MYNMWVTHKKAHASICQDERAGQERTPVANVRASAAAGNPAPQPHRGQGHSFTCYLCLEEVQSGRTPKRVNGRAICNGCKEDKPPPKPAALPSLELDDLDPDERRMYRGSSLALAGAW